MLKWLMGVHLPRCPSRSPLNPAMSVARPSTATYAAGMGYDILRAHGTKVAGTVDSEAVSGTAYFQKVCVQAPSPPWYWGVLHFEDGSYMDWFLPHLSPTMTARTPRPCKNGTFATSASRRVACFTTPNISEPSALRG